MGDTVSGAPVTPPRPKRVRAPRRAATGTPDLVARSAGVGLLIGSAIGLYAGFAGGGGVIGRPVVVTVGCMLAGLLLGLVIGASLAPSSRPPPSGRARRREDRTPREDRETPPDAAAAGISETPAPVTAAPPVAVPEGDHLVPPGWYPDPSGGPRQRFWDGERWTEHLWSPRER